jgi:S-adenosylmethionine synthetase
MEGDYLPQPGHFLFTS